MVPRLDATVLAFQVSPQLDGSFQAWLEYWRRRAADEFAAVDDPAQMANVAGRLQSSIQNDLVTQGASDDLIRFAMRGPVQSVVQTAMHDAGGVVPFLDTSQYEGGGTYTGPWTGVEPDEEPPPTAQPMTPEVRASLEATLAEMEAAVARLAEHVRLGLPGARDTMLAAVRQIDAIRRNLDLPPSNITVPPSPSTGADAPDASGMPTDGGSRLMVAGLVIGAVLLLLRRR